MTKKIEEKPKQYIIGIDPGTATTGYGVLEVSGKEPKIVTYGCISTPKNLHMPDRLLILQKGLRTVLSTYSADALVIENLFFGVNAKTAITVGQARGIIMVVAAEFGLAVYEYQGLSIKKAITGSGKADKKDMQKAMSAIFNIAEWEKPKEGYLDDAIDGLAIALFHLNKINGLV